MRPAALLLLALAGCGTARALKQSAERLGDASVALTRTADAGTEFLVVLKPVVPKLEHTLDTLDEAAHGSADATKEIASWLKEARPYVLGALLLGGPLVLRWLYRKWREKRRARRTSAPKP